MSNRQNVFKEPSPNPASRFLEWDSKNRCFKYWDKKNEKNMLQALPFTFVTLEEMTTVKGFDDHNQCGIYSNEVKRTDKSILTVKSFKGGEIAKGLYSKIKDRIKVAGAKYCKSVYAMTIEGELINVSFVGASLSAWFEFTEKTKARLSNEWVTVKGFTEGTKGATVYTMPTFEFDGSLDSEHGLSADQALDILEAYMEEYTGKTEAKPEIVETPDAFVNGEKETDIPDFLETEEFQQTPDFLKNGGEPI